jgi:hypothetical protein
MTSGKRPLRSPTGKRDEGYNRVGCGVKSARRRKSKEEVEALTDAGTEKRNDERARMSDEGKQ